MVEAGGGPVAEARGLTVHVDTGRWSETVIESVDLVVPAGRVTALLGESGCGKSMLAAALTGHLPAVASTRGDVLVNGVPVTEEREWRRLRVSTVGYLPQSGVTAFHSEADVASQLRKTHELRGVLSVEEACASALYPDDVRHLLPGQHSSGQVQRAALAAALIPAPTLLVVDEPTASLDTATARAVWATLRRCADAGTAVLAISHDVNHLVDLDIADEMVFVREGRVTAAGTPDEMRERDDPYLRGFFNPLGL